MTKAVRTRRKTAVLANMMKEIGLVKIIKMAGREKAPGLRMKDW